MIDRVEVLQDGASPIYGSDAIAGVVNVITKSSQKGFALSAQGGSYLDHNDGWTQNYQASWGNGDGPTQIVIGGNYVQADGVSSGARALSAFPGPYATDCVNGGGCSSFPLNTRFGGPAFGPSLLTLAHPITDAAPVFPTDFRAFTTADRFNFAPFNYLEIPLKRYGAFVEFQAGARVRHALPGEGPVESSASRPTRQRQFRLASDRTSAMATGSTTSPFPRPTPSIRSVSISSQMTEASAATTMRSSAG